MLPFLYFACSSPELTALPPPSSSAQLLLVLHGSGDTINDWPKELLTAIEMAELPLEEWDLWSYDWDRYAAKRGSAAKKGRQIGALIAERLSADEYDYEHIHLVAHSAGCFVAHGLSETMFELAPKISIHQTLLDPFTGYGLVRWGYGGNHFGEVADFTEAYTNTSDSVPSTNGTLDHAHNFDVTAIQPDGYEDSNAHWWPVDYYISTVGTDKIGYKHAAKFLDEGADDLWDEYPANEITELEE